MPASSMSASTLATGLQAMAPTTIEATGVQHFADAWATYFAASSANGVGYTANAAHKSAMISAMAGASAPNAGATAIQLGVVAWWNAVVSTGPATYSGCTLVTPPPTISTIAATLAPTLASNTASKLSLADACTAIAAVLHACNQGGTATFPPSVVSPIQ